MALLNPKECVQRCILDALGSADVQTRLCFLSVWDRCQLGQQHQADSGVCPCGPDNMPLCHEVTDSLYLWSYDSVLTKIYYCYRCEGVCEGVVWWLGLISENFNLLHFWSLMSADGTKGDSWYTDTLLHIILEALSSGLKARILDFWGSTTKEQFHLIYEYLYFNIIGGEKKWLLTSRIAAAYRLLII